MQKYKHTIRIDGLNVFIVTENNFIRELFGLKPKVTEYVSGCDNGVIYYDKNTGESIFEKGNNHYKLLSHYKNKKTFSELKKQYNL